MVYPVCALAPSPHPLWTLTCSWSFKRIIRNGPQFLCILCLLILHEIGDLPVMSFFFYMVSSNCKA